MLAPLGDPTYRHLFLAQLIALLGTGLMTVALALLAFDLAGAAAGRVLATALVIKMLAYIFVAPVIAAVAARLPRKGFLVAMDMIRAAVALSLPFVTEVWQIYVLIGVLQTASAGFTPAFQATIPDILEDEEVYTQALSLSRLAYDLESLISPMLAAALLLVMPFPALFAGTVLGFAVSALLVLRAALPPAPPERRPKPFAERITRGVRIYLATPRLRGLWALTLAAAAGGAFALVNTVVVVKAGLGLGERDVAVALAAFGAGSMLAALLTPWLLGRMAERGLMIAGAALCFGCMVLLAGLGGVPGWAALLPLWLVLGIGYSAVMTPAGRLLRRSAAPEDRAAIFTAQFALSHAAWLVAYPVAGILGDLLGLGIAAALLAVLALAGVLAALRVWPADDCEVLAHAHPELPPDHPHLRHGAVHAHRYVIDDMHHEWPRTG